MNFFRRCAALLSLLLLVPLCGCRESVPAPTLRQRGQSLVLQMAEAAANDAYLALYTADGAIRDKLAPLKNADYSTPAAVYQLTVPEETLAAAVNADALNGASEALKTYAQQRILAALPSQINAAAGAETLAAATVCTMGSTFVHAEPLQDCILLYVYADAAPVAVVFTAGQDGTVSASGTFLLAETFPVDSADSIAAYVSELNATVELLD